MIDVVWRDQPVKSMQTFIGTDKEQVNNLGVCNYSCAKNKNEKGK